MRHANDRRTGLPASLTRARLKDLTPADQDIKRTYNTWINLFGRCENPNNPAYGDYGGRGIKVCSRWYDFDVFVTDMGVRPEGSTLNRIDNNGHYEKDNCEWAAPAAQQRNKRSNALLTYRGETKTIAEWSEVSGVPAQRLAQRRRAGFSDAECFECSLDPGRSPARVYAGRIAAGQTTNAQGKHHFRAVLSEEQVLLARRSPESAASLARRWGVHKSTVLRARSGITYGDVQ